MPEILRYPTTIISVVERFEKKFLSGVAEDAKFENVSIGYFIITDLGIVLPCGQGKPEFTKGDRCRLTLEKMEKLP